MGYQGKGLNINGQGIVNPIKVDESPHYIGLGCVRKEVGEFSKTTSDQPTMNDGSTSTHSSDSEDSIGTYQRCTKNKHFKTVQKVWKRKNHCSHCNKDEH